jgi:DNA-binding transcriptional LysR family regulator
MAWMRRAMNLRDLQYLVALAEHRHFGHAADACFVSQPTLSTQIKKLEDELGVPLVERTPRKVLLTEVGRDIAIRARDVLNEIEQIRGVARRTLDPESGTVRLGIFPTLGPYLLPHVLPLVRTAFPRLELLLVEEKTEAVLRMLREGKLDAGILALPLHEDSLGRSDRGSSPWSRPRRSPGRTSPARRSFRRLPRARGAASSNRRRDRRGAGPLDLAGLAIAPFEHVLRRPRPLPLRAHVEQVDEEVVGQRLRAAW